MVTKMTVFGPVPSRRLGRSLGINNIPFKHCSYSCIYCQLGRTIPRSIERRPFHRPEDLLWRVTDKLEEASRANEPVDYLTFDSDGEPCLDSNLGQEIEMLKPLGIKIAVITNASLITQDDVIDALMLADFVSLKIDTLDETIWHMVNRPSMRIQLDSIKTGIRRLAAYFRGELTTETMLVRDINDHDASLESVADFHAQLHAAKAYLTVPTRPPSEKWVSPPDDDVLARALRIFQARNCNVELLGDDGAGQYSSTGKPGDDLLSITAVHPMSEQETERFLARAGADPSIIQDLIAQGLLQHIQQGARGFYRRKFR